MFAAERFRRVAFRTRVDPALVAVVAVAVLWRGLALFSMPLVLTADGLKHANTAFRLFSWSYDAWFQAWITPGYSLFLALIIGVFGVRPFPIVAAQTIIGLMSVVVYYKLGERCAGRAAGVAAALYVALHSGVVILEHTLLTESLALFLQGLAVLLAARVLESPHDHEQPRTALIAGAVAGAAAVVRPNLVVIAAAVVAVGFALAAARSWRHSRDTGLPRRSGNAATAGTTARQTALLAIGAAAVMSPWLVNNAVSHHRLGVLSGVANIGRLVFALQAGLLPPTLPELVAMHPALPVACETEMECGWHVVAAIRARSTSEYDVDDRAAEIMSRYVRAHPGEFARTLVRVLARQVRFDGDDRYQEVDEFVKLADRPDMYNQVMNAYVTKASRLAPLAVPRFGTSRRPVIWAFDHVWRFRYPFVFVLFLAALPAVVTSVPLALTTCVILAVMASLGWVFATADRYMLLLEPLMCVAGAAGVVRIARAIADAARRIESSAHGSSGARRLAAGVAVVSGILILERTMPPLLASVNERYQLETTAALAARGRPRHYEPKRLMTLARQADLGCTTTAARVALRALGLDSQHAEVPVAAWGAIDTCPAIWTTDLFGNGGAGGSPWTRDPGAQAIVEAISDSEGQTPLWHVRYGGGNWGVMSREVSLQPDSLYVYEMSVRSTAPLVALYWQTDLGRSFESGLTYPQWTPLRYPFITPAWDGHARVAHFSPVLPMGPGEIWIRGLRLSHVHVERL